MTSRVNVVAVGKTRAYDEYTVLLDKTTSYRLWIGVFCLTLGVILFSFPVWGKDGSTDSTMMWVAIVLCSVFLILATGASGYYFAEATNKVPKLIGIATFSAACGVGVGFSTPEAFATVVPILAAAYGAALVCAVSYRPKQESNSQLLGNASAASGIPLMLGAYFGNSINTLYLVELDPPLLQPESTVIRIIAAVLVLCFIALVVRLSKWLGSPDDRSAVRRETLVLAGSAFGAFIGLVTGLSPHPVVGYVAPASLALFSGAASCFFAATGPEGNREQARIGAILFGFGALLIVGLILGAVVRVQLGWAGALRTFFAFATLVIVAATLGASTSRARANLSKGLGFAFLGAGVGLVVGMSHTFIMHIVAPAILTMFTGLAAYVFINDQTHRKQSIRLLLVFGVTALLGAFVGSSLSQAELCAQADDLSERIVIIEKEHGEELNSTEEEVIEDAKELIAITDELREEILVWAEGNQASSAVLIFVQPGWQGTLTTNDRVSRESHSYEFPGPDRQVSVHGESLEIRWPSDAGRDAIRLLGWERVVQQGEEWTVIGDGVEVNTDMAELQGDQFVLIYPASHR